jgi:hypothetical protein
LASTIDEYLNIDDVIRPALLTTIIIRTSATVPNIRLVLNADTVLASWNASIFHLQEKTYGEPSILPGLYFYSNRGLRTALRLYPDTQEAFVSSVKISDSSSRRYNVLPDSESIKLI